MRRLIFIDDDKAELDAFRKIVSGHYDYTTVHWPSKAEKLFDGAAPDIFVSDLYLPPMSGDRSPTGKDREAAGRMAREIAERFAGLYTGKSCDDKARLRKTMDAISAAYGLLELQWKALGQSPDYGIELLRKLKGLYPRVPFIFYSRKITPEDVVDVLRAGANDAIRKGALTDKDVLTRLKVFC